MRVHLHRFAIRWRRPEGPRPWWPAAAGDTMPGRRPFGACVSRLEGGTMPGPEAAYHSAEPASGTTARHLACLTASNSDAGGWRTRCSLPSGRGITVTRDAGASIDDTVVVMLDAQTIGASPGWRDLAVLLEQRDQALSNCVSGPRTWGRASRLGPGCTRGSPPSGLPARWPALRRARWRSRSAPSPRWISSFERPTATARSRRVSLATSTRTVTPRDRRGSSPKPEPRRRDRGGGVVDPRSRTGAVTTHGVQTEG
jgi:hypothetical protein